MKLLVDILITIISAAISIVAYFKGVDVSHEIEVIDHVRTEISNCLDKNPAPYIEKNATRGDWTITVKHPSAEKLLELFDNDFDQFGESNMDEREDTWKIPKKNLHTFRNGLSAIKDGLKIPGNSTTYFPWPFWTKIKGNYISNDIANDFSKICPPPYFDFGGGCIVILSYTKVTWVEARDACEAHNGTLFTFRKKTHYKSLRYTLSSRFDPWAPVHIVQTHDKVDPWSAVPSAAVQTSVDPFAPIPINNIDEFSAITNRDSSKGSTDDIFDLTDMDYQLPSQNGLSQPPRPSSKSPTKFLGENSNLVNLYNLVSVRQAPVGMDFSAVNLNDDDRHFWIGGHINSDGLLGSSKWTWIDNTDMEMKSPVWGVYMEESCNATNKCNYNFYFASASQETRKGDCLAMDNEFDYYFSDQSCLEKRYPVCLLKED